MRRLTLLGLMVFAGAGAGCSSTTNPPGYGLGGSGGAPDGAAGTGGGGTGGGATDAAVDAAVDAPIAELAPPAPTGLVALNSDFSTTSLSILSTTGALVQADCVDSATGSGGGPTKTISGDAALPSQPQRGGNVVIVDHSNVALTFVNPSSCTITRQIAVPGVKTNPHDVVILAAAKAYVTRYDQNLAATDATLAGNDIAIINPTTGAQTGRIVLDAYASTVAGATILARPDRALIAGGQVVVSLNEASADFATFGEGRVVVIDPSTDQVVSSVALTGLSNCEGLSYVESSKTLLVPCGGSYGGPISQSGIAVVDLGASPPTLTRAIPATAFDGRPLGPFWVLALAPAAGGTRAFAVTNDPNDVDPDALFAFDYVAGTATSFATSDPYKLGQAAGASGLLLVPFSTAATPQIKLYDVSATPQATTSFTSDPVTNLPPQVVAWY
jgi:hypothetical protein